MSSSTRPDWGSATKRGLTGNQSDSHFFALHAGCSGEGWRAGLGRDTANLCFLGVGRAWVACLSLARVVVMKDERAGRGGAKDVAVFDEGDKGGGDGYPWKEKM